MAVMGRVVGFRGPPVHSAGDCARKGLRARQVGESEARRSRAATSSAWVPSAAHPRSGYASAQEQSIERPSSLWGATRTAHHERSHGIERLSHRCAVAAGADSTGAAGPSSSSKVEESPPSPRLRQGWRAWWAEGFRTVDRRTDALRRASEAMQDKSETRVDLGVFLREMVRLLKPDAPWFCFAVAMLLVAAGSELALPHYTAATIFSVTGAATSSFSRNIKIMVVLAAVYSISAAARGMTFGLLNHKFVYRLRCELFRNLVGQDAPFHDQAEVGVLTSRLTSDCNTVSRIIGMNINLLIRNSFKAFGGALYLWYLSPQFFLAAAGALAFIVAINLCYGWFYRKVTVVEQEQLAHSNQVAQEVLSQIRTVQTFGTEDKESSRYTQSLQHLMAIAWRQVAAYGMFLSSSSFFVNFTEVVCLMIGGYKAVRGELSAQQLTSFLFYTELVVTSALATCEQLANMQGAVGSSEKVLQLLKRKPRAKPSGKLKLTGPTFKGRIDFVNVDFVYPDLNQQLTLDGINISLLPGTVTALVGPSGGGKSTLIALLQNVYNPTRGSVLIDGVPIENLDIEWLRDQIGFVEQEPKLFELPVNENIAYGYEPAGKDVGEAVAQAANKANADGFVNRLPSKYDTWVGNNSLSGGQRQRLALARALIRDPKIFILDEATSALDAESEYQVQKALTAAMKDRNRTVLIIAHKLSTVKHLADNIVVLKDGKVVEQGTHRKLLKLRGVYANLARKQGDLSPPIPEDGGNGVEGNSVEGREKTASSKDASGKDAGTATPYASGDEEEGSLKGSMAESDDAVRIYEQ